jgi:hypothetical protein
VNKTSSSSRSASSRNNSTQFGGLQDFPATELSVAIRATDSDGVTGASRSLSVKGAPIIRAAANLTEASSPWSYLSTGCQHACSKFVVLPLKFRKSARKHGGLESEKILSQMDYAKKRRVSNIGDAVQIGVDHRGNKRSAKHSCVCRREMMIATRGRAD